MIYLTVFAFALSAVLAAMLVLSRTSSRKVPPSCPRVRASERPDGGYRPGSSDAECGLRELNDDLEQLLYIASHDLREPLVGAAGFISLIKRKRPDLDDETVEFLDEAISGMRLMEAKIDDLLTLSRAGRDALREPFLLSDAVRSGWALLNGQTRAAGAKLTVDGADVMVLGTKTMVEQVFQNLFTNALKYSRPGHPPDVRVTAEPSGRMVQVAVADNGIGFSQDHADRIFQPFQRLHTSDSEYPGTGIGLALVRKIVVKLGGEAWAKSVPGEGSTFYLTIPLAEHGEQGGHSPD
jgi:signal transduction histidine kinase